jgi:pyruvate,orthophosphate dikinase
MREMILAQDLSGRARALAKLMPMQKKDFKQIFAVMDNLPVTIRLLDPPLHEFLPYYDKKISELAVSMGIDFETLKNTIDSLNEVNPMLGHRGCRLAITYPEIYQMQVQAIVEAAIECTAAGITVHPEIEIPLVSTAKELSVLKQEVQEVLDEYKNAINFKIKIGTMIEVPRACLTADEIAEYADFFSFGTNDLTQTTFGLSRDDASKFIPQYLERGILLVDPAESIDKSGVGELMQIAVNKGRSTVADLEIGICGEHGGDPASIKFCHDIGLDYVSCSPYRVPIARIAAAQAVVKATRQNG